MPATSPLTRFAAIGLLGLAALAKLPTLGQPLTENFAWRQTQTAWTARIYHQQGIDLLHPEVPVHGPPWQFAFEFPLFQALGALLMDLGLAPDVAMRSLGLVTFLVSGWLLYALLTRLAGRAAGLAALAAFLFSPFGLLWGRTSLIEYLATAGALAFLLGAVRWLERGRPSDFVVALAAGVLAMLVKITTGAFYLVPLLAFRRNGRPLLVSEWSVPILVAVPSLAGLLWTRYADALKAATPATAFQTSANMIGFNFGSPDMRVDPEVMLPIASALLIGLTGAGLLIWLPAAIARLRQLEQGPLLAALLLSALVGAPLVLTPLYGTQNYYPAAISPAAAILVGLGASWGWARRRALLGRFVLIAGTLLWLVSLVMTGTYWLVSYEPVVDRDGSLAAAAFVRERTDPGDWVVIGGRNYDPTILYYAERRGYMLDPRRGTDDLDALRADPRYTLFVDCPYQGTCTLMADAE
jgi:Dolichyl-phosphate-mannose-protein mannosyltransferase